MEVTKRSLLLAVLLCLLHPLKLWPQQPFSPKGEVHTPAGDLHMLVIFVRYENASRMSSQREWPDVSVEGVLPEMAMGDPNTLFCADPQRLGRERMRNLSDYYYAMSGGTFRITADIFPIQVPVKYVPETGGNFFSRQEKMNQAAVTWIAQNYPDFDWSRYDRRKNHPGFAQDNTASTPDGILDYVVFMHREFGSTGMGSSGGLAIPGSTLRIQDGHTGIRSYADAAHNWEYFKHEFAHNLYNCPHYLGANNADGNRFYTQKGWGLMSAWHAPFFSANAWECWWLGWLEPQSVTQNDRYYLRDFVTGRDAIRIQLPGTQDVLWIENHQKKDPWDQKLFYGDSTRGQPQSAAGIYMYVVGAPGADRKQPQLNPFDPAQANMIRMLNGEGNFDYHFEGDTMGLETLRIPVLAKAASNPVAGQNDFQFLRQDFNGNGLIDIGFRHGNKDAGGREEVEAWADKRDSICRLTWACTGDALDVPLPGEVLGLSGTFPLLNYPVFDRKTQQLSPFLLNGIQIRFVGYLSDGSAILDISFDQWTINRPQRWCGNLLLQQTESHLPAPVLRLSSGAHLRLDLSGTPDRETRHPLTQTNSNPTQLVLKDSCGIVVEKGAVLELATFSSLILTDNAWLRLEKGSKLILGDEQSLVVEANARLIRARGAKVIRKKEE